MGHIHLLLPLTLNTSMYVGTQTRLALETSQVPCALRICSYYHARNPQDTL